MLQATEERYRNKGAYIVLEPPNFDTPVFHSFEAVTPRPKVRDLIILIWDMVLSPFTHVDALF